MKCCVGVYECVGGGCMCVSVWEGVCMCACVEEGVYVCMCTCVCARVFVLMCVYIGRSDRLSNSISTYTTWSSVLKLKLY